MLGFTLTIGLVLLPAIAAADDWKTRPFKTRFEGWAVVTGYDSNADGLFASVVNLKGKAKPGGEFERGASSEPLPWDGISFCSATEIRLEYEQIASVTRFEEGGLLQAVLTDSELCFDFVTNTFTFTLDFEIVGGTGRYEGASGSYTDTGTGSPFASGSEIISSLTGTSSGTITLPNWRDRRHHKSRHDRDWDDDD